MGIASPYAYVCYKDPDISTTWVAESNIKVSTEIVSNNPNTTLQTAIDNTETAGGGTIKLRADQNWGTTGIPLDINLKDNVFLEGEGWDSTRLLGRITTTGENKMGISKVSMFTNTLTSNGNANLSIKNTKHCIIRDCKVSSDLTADPLVYIDDNGGGAGIYSTTIVFDNCYILGRYRGVHMKGGINNIHLNNVIFGQTSGARSTDPNCSAIFIDNSGTADPLFCSFNNIYVEKYYAGIDAQQGYWNGSWLWSDDCEYGVILETGAVNAGCIKFEIGCPFVTGYLAKIGSTDYAPGASINRFVYESPNTYYLRRGVKY